MMTGYYFLVKVYLEHHRAVNWCHNDVAYSDGFDEYSAVASTSDAKDFQTLNFTIPWNESM